MSKSIVRGPFSIVFTLPRSFSIALSWSSNSRGRSDVSIYQTTTLANWHKYLFRLDLMTYLTSAVDEVLLIFHIHRFSLIECAGSRYFQTSIVHYMTGRFYRCNAITNITSQSNICPPLSLSSFWIWHATLGLFQLNTWKSPDTSWWRSLLAPGAILSRWRNYQPRFRVPGTRNHRCTRRLCRCIGSGDNPWWKYRDIRQPRRTKCQARLKKTSTRMHYTDCRCTDVNSKINFD